jgi:endo-1,4-beta-xylanase
LPGNEDFENGLTNWSTFNDENGAATISADTNPSDAHNGSGCMKVINPTANTSSQWKVQVAGPLVNTTVGTQYSFSYWVKASSSGGSIRLSTQDENSSNAQYQSDQTIGTSWQQISWTFTAKSTQTRVLFDMGQVADTYYIDDASFNQATSTANSAQTTAHKLDSVLGNWINTIVGRYANKIVAWDVINELFSDGNGAIRTNSNTTAAAGVFVWSNYLGKNYGVKAFNYAHTADPNALLFINDYNLETSTQKLDSLVAYVNWLKSQNVPIDGIGTQMHISSNTPQSGIDNAFVKLASTGLLVRISELDVVINTSKTANFTATADQLTQQAAMYYNVVNSYIKNVPASQRYAITVWGVHDPDSWITNDAPLLFDANYKKKSAYSGFVQALKAN